jgi:heptosyltransferase-1
MQPAPENVLLVKLSAIGDVIHTLPVLNAIKRHYPKARITWLVEEAAASLIEGHQALDRVLVSKRKRWLKGLSGPARFQHIKAAIAFIRDLRDTRYDLILDFQASLKGGVLIALARGSRKVGFGKGLEHQEYSYLFLNEKVPAVDMEIHALTRGLSMLASIGVPTGGPIEYRLPVSQNDRQAVAKLLKIESGDNPEKIIAINPVAQWETKLWENAKFAELADTLVDRYAVNVVFSGGAADRPVVEDICARMRNRVLNLSGRTTLKELAALYEQAACLISTDTGPMHLGAAVGIPVVALFGPTAPGRTGPFGDGHRVIRAPIECAPCFKRNCDPAHCMRKIEVAQVIDGIEQLGIL